MDHVNLRGIYTSGEFSDCTVVSSDEIEFSAHRLVIAQFPRIKDLLEQQGDGAYRAELAISSKVVDRMLKWMYGVGWEVIGAEAKTSDVSTELVELMDLCAAARAEGRPRSTFGLRALQRRFRLASCAGSHVRGRPRGGSRALTRHLT